MPVLGIRINQGWNIIKGSEDHTGIGTCGTLGHDRDSRTLEKKAKSSSKKKLQIAVLFNNALRVSWTLTADLER